MWCPRTESNRGPIDYKSIALPAELQGHFVSCVIFIAKAQLNQSKKNKEDISCSRYFSFGGCEPNQASTILVLQQS